MNELLAPYRFVPLSKKVLRPEWAHLVSHDHPFADGVSGVLELTLTAKTPLCVGGKQSPGQVKFYRTPDNQLAIPGSSIKGMLRNVLEIACFGSFKQVEDQKLGVRELVPGGNFYSDAMNRQPVQSGWLRYEQGQWRLIPCKCVRVHHQEIINAGLAPYLEWKRAKTVENRYRLLNGLRDITFIEPDKKEPIKIDNKGNKTGKLVVTGQPGKAYDEQNKQGSTKANKKYEFVFYDHDKTAEKIVSNAVISGFMQIYAESAQWLYWRKQLNSLQMGVPVFFHKDDKNQVKSLGLSLMYKLPYTLSLHDAINNTAAEHLAGQQPDLAGLIFGWLDESTKSGNNNLRGRVMPGMLTAVNPTPTKMAGPTVLSSPKPTFYPAYIRQASGKKPYKTLMDETAELAGWKRYPLQQKAHLPQLSGDVAKNKNVQITMETVNAGSVFAGKLRFHNLRLLELGALLWALDFGQREVCHNLGLGKPYGFGQVKLTSQLAFLQANNPAFQHESTQMLQQATAAFCQFMDKWCLQHLTPARAWEQTEQVTALLAAQQPQLFKTGLLAHYSILNDFRDAKGKKLRLPALPNGGASAPRRNMVSAPAGRPQQLAEPVVQTPPLSAQPAAVKVSAAEQVTSSMPTTELPVSKGRRVPVRRQGKPDGG